MKKHIESIVYFLLISLTSISCSPKIDLSNNTYQSFTESGLLMAGKTIRFEEDNRFEFKNWSDDLSSNKKGKGTYQIEGNALIFNFEEYKEPRNKVTKKTPTSPNSNVLEMHIQNLDQKPLVGVTCSLFDKQSKALAHCSTNIEGFCELESDKLSEAQQITVSYLGMNEEKIEVKGDEAKAYEVTLTEKTKYYPSGTRLIYTFKTKKDLLILQTENRIERLRVK